MQDTFVSIKEAAPLMGTTERWLQQQCKNGHIIGATRINESGAWLIPREYVATNMLKKDTLLSADKKKELELVAAKMRAHIINSVYQARSGHPGGSLSIAEMVSYLYFYRMNIDPANPKMSERDRFVLSKGHCAPAVYAALAMKGFFDIKELDSLRKIGAILQGHPDLKHIPGIDMSSGSLGQGISAACGMAYAAKYRKEAFKVYAILGDGELQEGQVWEAAMFAAAKGLNNLCIFVDFNNLQITGKVSEVLDLGAIDEKFRAFGWNTFVIDGHSFEEIDSAWHMFENSDKPTAVICNTIKGKGVSFMEDNLYWHGNAPKGEEYEKAIAELNQKIAELEERK